MPVTYRGGGASCAAVGRAMARSPFRLPAGGLGARELGLQACDLRAQVFRLWPPGSHGPVYGARHASVTAWAARRGADRDHRPVITCSVMTRSAAAQASVTA